MKYYKVQLEEGGETYFWESKKPLSDGGVLRDLIEAGDIDKNDITPTTEVSEISEDEYEENSY